MKDPETKDPKTKVYQLYGWDGSSPEEMIDKYCGHGMGCMPGVH